MNILSNLRIYVYLMYVCGVGELGLVEFCYFEGSLGGRIFVSPFADEEVSWKGGVGKV